MKRRSPSETDRSTLSERHCAHGRTGRAAKRVLDVLIAGMLLLALFPVLLIVALVVRLTMGAPVLFRHVRPGLGGKPFALYKFRTMAEPREGQRHQHRFFSDEQRLTRVGRFLRKSSLDELPQLTNILRGDMSFVGPRPLLMEYLPRYSTQHGRRHESRPGITGLAQIRGRQGLPFSKRLDLDVWYVDHWSLWLDFKIMLETIPRVLGLDGVVDEQRLDEIDDIGLAADLFSSSGPQRSKPG